jgi:hypothetical protein
MHEAAKCGNLDIIHFLLTETYIDPNMIGRGNIYISGEGSKWPEEGNSYFSIV